MFGPKRNLKKYFIVSYITNTEIFFEISILCNAIAYIYLFRTNLSYENSKRRMKQTLKKRCLQVM